MGETFSNIIEMVTNTIQLGQGQSGERHKALSP